MGKKVDKIPTGKIARTTITGISAAKVGIKHLSHMGKKKIFKKYDLPEAQEQHEQEIGKIIFSALSQLRGTALKVAQMLSMEESILPEPIRKELAKAFHQALPMNRALIHKVFQNEFGKGYDKVFDKEMKVILHFPLLSGGLRFLAGMSNLLLIYKLKS